MEQSVGAFLFQWARLLCEPFFVRFAAHREEERAAGHDLLVGDAGTVQQLAVERYRLDVAVLVADGNSPSSFHIFVGIRMVVIVQIRTVDQILHHVDKDSVHLYIFPMNLVNILSMLFLRVPRAYIVPQTTHIITPSFCKT